jgi:hypothetical protein
MRKILPLSSRFLGSGFMVLSSASTIPCLSLLSSGNPHDFFPIKSQRSSQNNKRVLDVDVDDSEVALYNAVTPRPRTDYHSGVPVET